MAGDCCCGATMVRLLSMHSSGWTCILLPDVMLSMSLLFGMAWDALSWLATWCRHYCRSVGAAAAASAADANSVAGSAGLLAPCWMLQRRQAPCRGWEATGTGTPGFRSCFATLQHPGADQQILTMFTLGVLAAENVLKKM